MFRSRLGWAASKRRLGRSSVCSTERVALEGQTTACGTLDRPRLTGRQPYPTADRWPVSATRQGDDEAAVALQLETAGAVLPDASLTEGGRLCRERVDQVELPEIVGLSNLDTARSQQRVRHGDVEEEIGYLAPQDVLVGC